MSAPGTGSRPADIALLAFLGLLVLSMLYLSVQLERTRAVLEPVARSPLLRALSATS